jgi:hypothetical protein
MPKPRKRAAAPGVPAPPHVGDKVEACSEMVYEISRVSQDG